MAALVCAGASAGCVLRYSLTATASYAFLASCPAVVASRMDCSSRSMKSLYVRSLPLMWISFTVTGSAFTNADTDSGSAALAVVDMLMFVTDRDGGQTQ